MESKFSKWLLSLFNTTSHSEMMTLGFFLTELDNHLFRKEAATYAQSKCGGSSMISVYCRAGWSISNVQQRYIFSTEGGGQMVGWICVEASGTLTILLPYLLSS